MRHQSYSAILKRSIFIFPIFVCIATILSAQKIDSTWTKVRQFINQPMPPVSGVTIKGDKIDASFFQNNVVLLSFANLINVGSLQQIPFLNRIENDFQGHPFKILSVIPNAKQDVVDFNSPEPVNAEAYQLRQTFGLPAMNYPVVATCDSRNEDGTIGVACDAVVKDYLIGGYPTICLIDQKGIVRYVHVGFAQKEQQEQWINDVENQIDLLLKEQQ